MADTAFLRKQLQGQIQATEDHLRALKDKLAAVDAVERLDLEIRGHGVAERNGQIVLQALKNLSTRTVADAAAIALKEMGGEAHGKDLLPRVIALKPIGGSNQMEALGAAMARDPARFERTRPNYWKLRRAIDGPLGGAP